MTAVVRIIAGIEAKELLGSTIMQAAFHAIEKAALDELIETEIVDDLRRCRLVERVRAIRDVRAAIESIRMTGKMTANKAGAAFD
jgi:hypothetical protein